jgi:hypothetical protein
LACSVAGACHRRSDKVVLWGGETLEIGREIELAPGAYSWSFRANPGDTFHVRAFWPAGQVKLTVSSDFRDGEDDDDASQMRVEEGTPVGPHRSEATLRVSPKANTASIGIAPRGRGSESIRLRIDRGP